MKFPKFHVSFPRIRVRRADMERLLIVGAAALVVVLALRDTRQSQLEMVYEEQFSTVTQTSAGAADTVSSNVPMQSTVVWYEDGDGYLVPVTRQIPQQEGVAKATLALMVQSSENDLAAARLGLRTVIPEGTTFDVDISGGKARVDMSAAALNCSSAEEELLMVQATAAALCGFDTVEEVSFLFDGQKRSQLTYGTDVTGVFSVDSVNVESVATMADSTYADQVQLYFPSASGRLLVPVTRTVFSPADLPTAILELVKGPKTDSGLETPVPSDCGVKSVKIKDGVATIDFTSEFAAVAQQDDGGQQAIRAVLFTASQFPGVKQVQILVEGQPYQAEPAAATTFVNDAQDVIAQYPGVVEID
ncbi:MAG: GerMN domain-containing protein [Christensenellaceae bacterium]|nr:GerMN domain-containing protein [Christensenellaceae bacterium]